MGILLLFTSLAMLSTTGGGTALTGGSAQPGTVVADGAAQLCGALLARFHCAGLPQLHVSQWKLVALPSSAVLSFAVALRFTAVCQMSVSFPQRAGAVLAPCSILVIIYALAVYIWRQRVIARRDPTARYDDLVGPPILVALILAVCVTSIVIAIRYTDFGGVVVPFPPPPLPPRPPPPPRAPRPPPAAPDLAAGAHIVPLSPPPLAPPTGGDFATPAVQPTSPGPARRMLASPRRPLPGGTQGTMPTLARGAARGAVAAVQFWGAVLRGGGGSSSGSSGAPAATADGDAFEEAQPQLLVSSAAAQESAFYNHQSAAAAAPAASPTLLFSASTSEPAADPTALSTAAASAVATSPCRAVGASASSAQAVFGPFASPRGLALFPSGRAVSGGIFEIFVSSASALDLDVTMAPVAIPGVAVSAVAAAGPDSAFLVRHTESLLASHQLRSPHCAPFLSAHAWLSFLQRRVSVLVGGRTKRAGNGVRGWPPTNHYIQPVRLCPERTPG